jgi:hypothetical protein
MESQGIELPSASKCGERHMSFLNRDLGVWALTDESICRELKWVYKIMRAIHYLWEVAPVFWSLFATALFVSPCQSQVTNFVPGTGNPWLAGMPNGSVASHPYGSGQQDSAPAESPVQISGIQVASGVNLTFTVTGQESDGSGAPFTGPNGDTTRINDLYGGAENGIADVFAPFGSLLGVFLDYQIPSQFTAPSALDFSESIARDFVMLEPGLRQPFFIGSGTNSAGVVQQFVAPEGATRLFLGPMDSEQWDDNEGGYTVVVNVVQDVAPTITEQPESVVLNAYDNASFSVTASGPLLLNYQWSLNGTNISGANSGTLTISHITQTNLGMYAVVVSNEFGSVTSSNAMLSMYPSIVAPFTGAVTYWGQTNTLSVEAWGTGPLFYQWFDDGNTIDSATNQDLTLTTIQATNAGLYSVVVSSALGSVTNPPAQVIVEPAGVCLGFSPTLTISGVPGYTYVIQSSTNLADTNGWATITNLTLTQSNQLWVDTNVNASSPFNPMHFYQVLPGQ